MRADTPDAAPMTVANLTVTHGGATVFSDLSLCVRPGEIFGLIGLNGAGKTSLIKAALALLEPEAGEVRFFGIPHSRPESRQKAAYLPEHMAPPRQMRGMEFLRFMLGLHGLVLDPARAGALAGAIDLDPAALERRTGGYSKGMGQKLGLLAALLCDCPLLLLDEPMSGLDPRARILLKVQMLARRDLGHSIFLSSHILTDLDELCDRIAILHAGRLLFTGPPADLRQAHGESLERAFLAAINGAG